MSVGGGGERGYIYQYIVPQIFPYTYANANHYIVLWNAREKAVASTLSGTLTILQKRKEENRRKERQESQRLVKEGSV